MRTQPDYIIRQLEIHNSRLNKEDIIRAAHEEGLPEFFEGLRMALDPLVTFGVKQVPVKEEDGVSRIRVLKTSILQIVQLLHFKHSIRGCFANSLNLGNHFPRPINRTSCGHTITQ